MRSVTADSRRPSIDNYRGVRGALFLDGTESTGFFMSARQYAAGCELTEGYVVTHRVLNYL